MIDSKLISIRKAALTAGVTLLALSIIAPFAELYIFPKLVNPESDTQTIQNIIQHRSVFICAIFSYLLVFTGDIILARAFYILLAPVNNNIAALAAIFRFVFAVIGLFAVLNLVTVFRILHTTDYQHFTNRDQLNGQVIFCLKSFKTNYHFGIIFFSFHLVLLGRVIISSGYIPKLMGTILVISGLGYLTDVLKPFLFPDLNTNLITITFFGELIFMGWLLIKGNAIGKLRTFRMLYAN